MSRIHRPVQEGIENWKAKTSLRSLPGSQQEGDPRVGLRFLTPYLCYACHTTLTSRSSRGALQSGGSSVRLPVWVNSSFVDYALAENYHDAPSETGLGRRTIISEDERWQKRKVDEEEMKQSIEAFLIS